MLLYSYEFDYSSFVYFYHSNTIVLLSIWWVKIYVCHICIKFAEICGPRMVIVDYLRQYYK
jgi:hypothetical protein